MHVAKYKAAAAPMMMHHYRRDRAATLARPNVDASRTALNYVIGDARGYEAVSEAVEYVNEHGARKVRADAVVLADLVVTLPDNVPARDERKFFEACYEFLGARVGEKNLLGGYVHKDEKTPHMHVPFVPLTTNAKGAPTISFKRLCPRSFYNSLHADMTDFCMHKLGYAPHLLLDESERAGRVYAERTEDIDAMRASVDRLTARERERAESAKAEAEEAEQDAFAADISAKAANAALAESQAALDALRAEVARERERVEVAKAEREKAEKAASAARDEQDAAVERLELVRRATGGIERETARVEREAERVDACAESLAGVAARPIADQRAVLGRIPDAIAGVGQRSAEELGELAGCAGIVARIAEQIQEPLEAARRRVFEVGDRFENAVRRIEEAVKALVDADVLYFPYARLTSTVAQSRCEQAGIRDESRRALDGGDGIAPAPQVVRTRTALPRERSRGLGL